MERGIRVILLGLINSMSSQAMLGPNSRKLPDQSARRWHRRRTRNTKNRLLAQSPTPELFGRMQHRYLSLSLRKNVDLSELQLGSMLLLRPFVVSDTLTKLAGVFAVEGLCQAGLKPITRRVFDDHSHPCRRLENSPMSAKKLENSC
jgi:hypothetical protein